MTTTVDKLPEFEGTPVHKAAMKFTGAGTGLSEGLAVQPVALNHGERAYFVIEAHCAGVSHDEDKDGYLTRVHKLRTEHMAPISEDLARQAIQQYAQQVEAAKAASDGQLALDDEQAAAEREAADATDSAADIAAAASARAKNG
jgi:hypothetical protein